MSLQQRSSSKHWILIRVSYLFLFFFSMAQEFSFRGFQKATIIQPVQPSSFCSRAVRGPATSLLGSDNTSSFAAVGGMAAVISE